jgi:hypothetical protein
MTNSFFGPSEDDEDDFPLASQPIRTGPKPREDALALLPRVMLAHTLGKSGMAKLWGSRSLCLVVQTRSDEWVGPIDRFLRQYGDWNKTVTKTADEARRRDDITGPDVLRRLADGSRVAVVASRYGHLRDAMITAADIKIELPPVTTDIIEAAIAWNNKAMAAYDEPTNLVDRTPSCGGRPRRR